MYVTASFFAMLSACTMPNLGEVVKGGAEPDDSAEPDTDDDRFVPAVHILSPTDGSTVGNPVSFTIAADDVASVAMDADGYALGEAWDPATSTELSYTFSGTGYPRVVTLRGYDADGAEVASDAITITVAGSGVQLEVPYFYQYDNAYEPGSTCGLTSAAMLVDFWHPDAATPDSLYLDYGKAQGQSPSALAALYEAEGLVADWTTSGTRDQIRAHLDAGRPVIVHGWWTSAGHVTVIVGYDETDWIVNDPAGDWYDCYGCGGGEAVRYPLDGAWDEEMSVDGDLWWSTASTSAF